MQHLVLEAKTTAVDVEQGTFTGVASAWSADREGDEIDPGAFTKTIAAWRASGKRLPLLFEHGTTAVGSIDPSTMHVTEQGLVVSGEVDRDTPEGRQVWRQIKAGTIGFSIGFMSESKPRKGGGRTLTEIDLLEISATSTPMHPAARVLDWKATTSRDRFAGFFSHEAFTGATGKRDPDARLEHELAQRREVEELAAKRAKAAKPIQIKTFEV
jgi:HK97 family phage prohead protease